ncbi:MAG: hypothetical protein ACTSSN_09475 [Candidatus Heimdallarchaeaceae archaeon]
MSENTCYIHTKYTAVNECNRCKLPICDECSKTYWQTNALLAMFQSQTHQQEEIILCPGCLRKTRIRNGFFPGLLLILILGMIAAGIIFGVNR